MATMAMQRGAGGGYVQRSSSAGLYEILDLLLDKGLVVDVFLRVSLVGIELLTVDARIVIASVDTYLRFAEAVNRLDLTETGGEGLPEIMENITEDGAASKTKGVLEGAKEKLFGSDDEDDDEKSSGSSGSRSSRSGSSQRAAGSGSGSRSRQRASTRGRS
jgi:gas vesicle structural protein